MCLTLGLVCVQLLDLQIRNTICRHWKYVSPSDPGVYKWFSIYKYKIQDVCTWNRSHPGTSVSATVTTFHGLLWPFSATQRFPRIFSTIPTMSTNVLLFCALAPFSTLHQTYFDFLGGGATGYPYSWHNVDILIVVTMLNVDTWRRSNVGWQKLSPSMQSTDCSPFHYPPHICIGFCSYLHFWLHFYWVLLVFVLGFAHICIGFGSYLNCTLLIFAMQIWLHLQWAFLIFALHFAHICNALLIAFALSFVHNSINYSF